MTFAFAETHTLERSEPRTGTWQGEGGALALMESALELTPRAGSIVSCQRSELTAIQLSRDGDTLCVELRGSRQRLRLQATCPEPTRLDGLLTLRLTHAHRLPFEALEALVLTAIAWELSFPRFQPGVDERPLDLPVFDVPESASPSEPTAHTPSQSPARDAPSQVAHLQAQLDTLNAEHQQTRRELEQLRAQMDKTLRNLTLLHGDHLDWGTQEASRPAPLPAAPSVSTPPQPSVAPPASLPLPHPPRSFSPQAQAYVEALLMEYGLAYPGRLVLGGMLLPIAVLAFLASGWSLLGSSLTSGETVGAYIALVLSVAASLWAFWLKRSGKILQRESKKRFESIYQQAPAACGKIVSKKLRKDSQGNVTGCEFAWRAEHEGKRWYATFGEVQHDYFKTITSQLIKTLDVGSPIIVLLDQGVSMVYVDQWPTQR